MTRFKRTLACFALLAAAVAVPEIANAGLITFQFAGSGGQSATDEYFFTVPGTPLASPTLRAAAGGLNVVYQSADGLGVVTDHWPDSFPNLLDNANSELGNTDFEILQFKLTDVGGYTNHLFQIVSVGLAHVDGNVTDIEVRFPEESEFVGFSPSFVGSGEHTFPPTHYFHLDQTMILRPYLFGDNDKFAVTSLTLETLEQSSAVPEPSTIALLGIGVVGLFGFGFRRRHSSKSDAKQSDKESSNPRI